MTVNKWDSKKKKYNKVNIPSDWKISTFEFDMNTIVNCVNCGKEVVFGDGYTSRRYHTEMGMGYSECEECYFSYKE